MARARAIEGRGAEGREKDGVGKYNTTAWMRGRLFLERSLRVGLGPAKRPGWSGRLGQQDASRERGRSNGRRAARLLNGGRLAALAGSLLSCPGAAAASVDVARSWGIPPTDRDRNRMLKGWTGTLPPCDARRGPVWRNLPPVEWPAAHGPTAGGQGS